MASLALVAVVGGGCVRVPTAHLEGLPKPLEGPGYWLSEAEKTAIDLAWEAKPSVCKKSESEPGNIREETERNKLLCKLATIEDPEEKIKAIKGLLEFNGEEVIY